MAFLPGISTGRPQLRAPPRPLEYSHIDERTTLTRADLPHIVFLDDTKHVYAVASPLIRADMQQAIHAAPIRSFGLTDFMWAIALAVYISKEWPHFAILQKVLLLAVIGVNVFTSVLLYLMIVVVFRVYLDLARMVFILLLHIGTAVMFTFYGHSFSCAIFNSDQICKDIDLSFVVGSWAIAGLNLGYIIYLLIMVPVPRPLPKVVPNLLLNSDTSRPFSMSSTTGLLRHDTVGSDYSLNLDRSGSRTAPKNLFLTNPDRPVRSASYVQRGGKYGAMGIPAGLPPVATDTSGVPSMRIGYTINSGIPPSLQSSFSRNLVIRRSLSSSSPASPKPLPLPNPFLDPMPRYGTPASIYSTASLYDKPMDTETGQAALERYQPLVPAPPHNIGFGPGYPGYGPVPSPSLPSTSAYPVPAL
ncbi:hypothetical protein NM688_g5279 [Phlebia brevispora]|uniref:Uncharacterized protein n=1 Tax=Phlebia brevispora TaxID=194682 RepID=A0ACC1SXV1_9APHY|nr:hypothetical protein NM688_g5279 [Phlebia brevispora]